MAASRGEVFRAWFPLFLTHITQGVQVTTPFVVSVYMVRGFLEQRQQMQDGPGSQSSMVGSGSAGLDEQQAARLTGLLTASFSAAQLLTSYPLGRLSDRIGRKPLMVLGNFACVVSILWYGLSASFAWALGARIVGGLFNCIIGVEKAIIGEGVSKGDQPVAFGLFSMMWGIGSLIGPMLGGALSQPCQGALRVDALCTPSSLLIKRPYFLPCLVAALLNVWATVACMLQLRETLPSKASSQCSSSEHADGRSSVAYHKLSTAAPEGDVRGQHSRLPAAGLELTSQQRKAAGTGGLHGSVGEQQEAGDVEAGVESEQRRPFRGDSAYKELDKAAARHAAAGSSSPDVESSSSASGWADAGEPGSSSGSEQQAAGRQARADLRDLPADGGGQRLHQTQQQGQEYQGQGWQRVALDDSPRHPRQQQQQHPQQQGQGQAVPWYRQAPVVMALAGYSLIAFLFSMNDELIPIFAAAPIPEGGLGLSTMQLAPSLACSGIVLMGWSLFGFPWLVKHVGTVRACRIGLWHSIPVALSIPAISLVARHPAATQALLFLTLGLKAVAATNAFTACLILVNAAAPKGSLGSVNGVGQTLASFVRAAAPACGGLSWAWALQLAGGTGYHQFLPFVAAAAVTLAADLVYWGLRLPEEEVEGGHAADSGPATVAAE